MPSSFLELILLFFPFTRSEKKRVGDGLFKKAAVFEKPPKLKVRIDFNPTEIQICIFFVLTNCGRLAQTQTRAQNYIDMKSPPLFEPILLVLVVAKKSGRCCVQKGCRL